MKKINFPEVWKPALILAVICLIITAALAGTNALTKTPIANLEAEAERTSRQEVLPEASSFEAYDETPGAPFCGKDSSGKSVGYVFITEAKGYGGSLKVMTGINCDGSVTGVKILSNSETVGLGANCTKESFTNQFQGAITPAGYIVDKTGSAENGINALTGATITSRAVVSAVNQAIEAYFSLS